MAKTDTVSVNERPLATVIKEFVIPNCMEQIKGKVKDVAIPFIVSKPGAGKTSIIEQLCKKNGIGFLSLHIALKPMEEMSGLPMFHIISVNGQEVQGTSWTITDLVTKLWEMHEEKTSIEVDGQILEEPKYSMIILLYDDAHLCGAGHMAFFYEPFTERTIRGYALPPTVAQVMAGNDSNKAGARAFFSAIMNRCAKLPTYATFQDWKEGFAIPQNIHPAVMSFLGKDTYSQFFHGEETQDSPWASPRSWSRFSAYVELYESYSKKRMPMDMLLYYGEAHVGKSASNEFAKYYTIFTKFDLDKILSEGKKFEMPENDIDKYALAFALISHYCGAKEIRTKHCVDFAHIIHKYIKEAKEIALIILKDVDQYEAVVGDKTIFRNLSSELEKLEKGILHKIISQTSSL